MKTRQRESMNSPQPTVTSKYGHKYENQCYFTSEQMLNTSHGPLVVTHRNISHHTKDNLDQIYRFVFPCAKAPITGPAVYTLFFNVSPLKSLTVKTPQRPVLMKLSWPQSVLLYIHEPSVPLYKGAKTTDLSCSSSFEHDGDFFPSSSFLLMSPENAFLSLLKAATSREWQFRLGRAPVWRYDNPPRFFPHPGGCFGDASS